MRRRALLAASQTGGGGNLFPDGFFPLYFYSGMTTKERYIAPNDTTLQLRDILIPLILEKGEFDGSGKYLTAIDFGIEVYLDDKYVEWFYYTQSEDFLELGGYDIPAGGEITTDGYIYFYLWI
mgnify:CR=1 FL=1